MVSPAATIKFPLLMYVHAIIHATSRETAFLPPFIGERPVSSPLFANILRPAERVKHVQIHDSQGVAVTLG